jgi:hypothetical protein
MRLSRQERKIVIEVFRMMTAYTNSICDFAERAGRLPTGDESFVRTVYPIEVVALRLARERVKEALGQVA